VKIRIRAMGKRALLPAAVLVVLTACGEAEVDGPRTAAVRPVKLLTVGAAAADESRRYPALIDAAQSFELSFQVGGMIEEVLVIESQEIDEGATIARLGSRNFANDLASARAQFDNAEEEYQRAVRLAAEDAIATSVLEQRETQRDVALSQLDSAEKALADTELVAPFSGVVANLSASRLENVQPGQPVATLISADVLEAIIDLPAAVLAQTPTRTNSSAHVLLAVAPNVRIPADFTEANLVADATSQTYSITFSFSPPEDLIILPGMSATVELSSTLDGISDSRVSVPIAAVGSDGEGQYVWVVDEESMTVSRRDVTIEPGIGENVVVIEGLVNGETIVGAGATLVSEGLQVRAWTE